MTTYISENNINFYQELFKGLDETDDDDDTNLCQITGLPLTTNHVILECKHHFNYDALYKEICIQKFVFKTYELHTLSKQEQSRVRDSRLNYFLKCPYCRNIQLTILPYYEELGHDKKYGVNSLDKNLPNSLDNHNHNLPYYGTDDYTFKLYNNIFKKGVCCETSFGTCSGKYVALIHGTELSYCTQHYRTCFKNHKIMENKKLLDIKIKQKEDKIKQKEDKIKQKEDKIKQKEDKIKQKEDKIKQKKQLLEQHNIERTSKGLQPLKRIIGVKKTLDNIDCQPEPEPENELITFTECKTILKFGTKKGTICGCKKVNLYGLCKRHEDK